MPLPNRDLKVVWRAGLDLNPLQVDFDGDMTWLATLVWPEQLDRLARLNSAIEVARMFDPGVIRGDLRTDLIALCDPGAERRDAGHLPHCGSGLGTVAAGA